MSVIDTDNNNIIIEKNQSNSNTNNNNNNTNNSNSTQEFKQEDREKVLNTEFSVYNNVFTSVKDKKTGSISKYIRNYTQINMTSFINAIKFGCIIVKKPPIEITSHFIDKIKTIRKHKEAFNYTGDAEFKNKIDKIKTELYPSTLARKSDFRDRNFIESEYTGFFQIDIDDEVNPSTLEALKKDPFLICVFKSPTGKGVKGVIYSNNTMQEHETVFEQIKYYFHYSYDITLDPSVKDINRFCYLSYDPEIYTNDNFIPFVMPSDIDNEMSNDIEYTIINNIEATSESLEIFYKMIDHLKIDCYNSFFKVICVAKQIFKLEYDEVDKYFKNDPNYNYKNNLSMYTGLKYDFDKHYNLFTIRKLLIEQDKDYYNTEIKTYFDQLKKELHEQKEALKYDELNKLTINFTDQGNKTIKDSLLTPNNSIILAPTGIGKTTSCISLIDDFVNNKLPDVEFDMIVYVTNTKETLSEVENKLSSLSNPINLTDKKILCLRSDTQDNFKEHKDNAKVILTHHTYINRKGLTPYLYDLYDVIRNNKTLLIIDEAESYINKCSYSIELESLYKENPTKNSNNNYCYKLYGCPKFNKSGNCTHCKKNNNNSYNNADNHIWKYKTESKLLDIAIKNNTYLHDIKKKDFDEILVIDESFDVIELNKQVFKIKQDLNNDIPINFDDGNKPEPKESFPHLINSSYNPIIVINKPVNKKKNIFAEVEDITDAITAKDDTFLDDIKYPASPCNIRTLLGIDLYGLIALKKYAYNVKFISATISEDSLNVINKIYSDIDKVEISSDNGAPKIDYIVLVGLKGSITINAKLIDLLNDNNYKLFRVTPTINDSIAEYRKYKNIKTINCILIKADSENDYKKNTHKDGVDIIFSHANSSITRGNNLTEYSIADIDANLFKPNIAFIVNSTDPETLKKAVEKDRINTIIQSIGRILRTDGKKDINIKLALIENIKSKSELDHIVYSSGWNSLVNNKVITNYIDVSNDIWNNTNLNEYIESVLKDNDINQPIKVLNNKMDKVMSMKDSGKSKRDIHRAIHYNRLSEDDKLLVDSIIS